MGNSCSSNKSASPPSVTSRSRGSHKKARKKKTKSSEKNKSPVQVETAEEQQQQTDSPNESLEITAESPAPEPPPPPPPPTFKVQVNVYALEVVNVHIQYGFGIFHTGVEVHRNEWAYGGHQYDLPGIFRMKQPRNLKSLSDIDGVFTFLKTLPMGTTGRTLPEVVEVLRHLGLSWRGKDYHLFYKNCNHFTNAFLGELCGEGVRLPEWVNRSSRVLCRFPLVIEMIPPQYLSPPALQNSVKKELRRQTMREKMKEKKRKLKQKRRTASGGRAREKSSSAALTRAPSSSVESDMFQSALEAPSSPKSSRKSAGSKTHTSPKGKICRIITYEISC